MIKLTNSMAIRLQFEVTKYSTSLMYKFLEVPHKKFQDGSREMEKV
jgi:hypothetical protein